MIKGRQFRSHREGTFLFIHFNRRRYWTHWCALVRWIHYPLLISLIKIISKRRDAEKEKKKTFDIWSYSSILGGCNVIFSTWSVTFPVFSLKNSSNFQHFLKNRDMDNTSVTKRMRRTHTHNPPPPLQLLGCGGGGGSEWGGGYVPQPLRLHSNPV